MKAKNEQRGRLGFTLPEIIIAVGIFSTVSTVVASLYIQSFRETRRANLESQAYEDARFIMGRIAEEVRSGMIDYDEYYNQHIVIPSLNAGVAIPGIAGGTGRNFGQNFGRYYSAFFHPGQDEALGFDCNTVNPADGAVGQPGRTAKRNQRSCTPLRKTIDRNTGANPFTGKYAPGAGAGEDAFCGTVSYATGAGAVADRYGECDPVSKTPDALAGKLEGRLYLLSADGRTKTILAREKIGETTMGGAVTPVYTLALLRLKGLDTDRDGVSDRFVCGDDFQCRGADDAPGVSRDDHGIVPTAECAPLGAVVPAELPRRGANLPNGESSYSDLDEGAADACDSAADGFSRDFVPISPLRVNVSRLNFSISPSEDPHYAFSEAGAGEQPRVTIVLTVEGAVPLGGSSGETLPPVTLIATVSSRVLNGVAAPLLVQ